MISLITPISCTKRGFNMSSDHRIKIKEYEGIADLFTDEFIGFLVSLLITYWGSKNYPSATFYFLHTRMWELIAGSLLAYFEINLGARSNNKTLNQILPVLGLFLIGHSIIFF